MAEDTVSAPSVIRVELENQFDKHIVLSTLGPTRRQPQGAGDHRARPDLLWKRQRQLHTEMDFSGTSEDR